MSGTPDLNRRRFVATATDEVCAGFRRCVSCWRGEVKVIDPNARGWFEKLRARWTAGG